MRADIVEGDVVTILKILYFSLLLLFFLAMFKTPCGSMEGPCDFSLLYIFCIPLYFMICGVIAKAVSLVNKKVRVRKATLIIAGVLSVLFYLGQASALGQFWCSRFHPFGGGEYCIFRAYLPMPFEPWKY